MKSFIFNLHFVLPKANKQQTEENAYYVSFEYIRNSYNWKWFYFKKNLNSFQFPGINVHSKVMISNPGCLLDQIKGLYYPEIFFHLFY